MDKTQELYNLQKRLSKIETWDRINRLVMLACIITSLHSLTFINTDKKLNFKHYLGYACGMVSVVCASKLQSKKQKYADKWHQLQRG